jgi:hypothetical protein
LAREGIDCQRTSAIIVALIAQMMPPIESGRGDGGGHPI